VKFTCFYIKSSLSNENARIGHDIFSFSIPSQLLKQRMNTALLLKGFHREKRQTGLLLSFCHSVSITVREDEDRRS